MLDTDQRGCALANAAVELPEKDHPARSVIEQYKIEQRGRLVGLCAASGVDEPELLADELFLLLEGAHVSVQSFGPNGPASRLVRMGEALIASHLVVTVHAAARARPHGEQPRHSADVSERMAAQRRICRHPSRRRPRWCEAVLRMTTLFGLFPLSHVARYKAPAKEHRDP